MLNLSIFLDLIGNILNFIHFFEMSLSGNGIFVFNVISTISSMASNFIITSLIILIAGGWSITFIDLGNNLLK